MIKLLRNCWHFTCRGLKNGFKNHKWYLLGWVSTWLMPLAALSTYFAFEQKTRPKISFEPWAILVLAILLIIYYKKGKAALRTKIQTSKAVDKVVNPILYLINGATSVASLGVVYWLVDLLNKINLDNLLNYLIIVIASVGFGALCYALDAVNGLAREETSLKEKEKL